MDLEFNNPAQVLLVVGIAVVLLFVLTSLVSGVVDIQEPADSDSTAVLLDGTNWVTIADTVGESETVYDSRGNAVALKGVNDSYIRSSEDIQFRSDDNWTVSLWASRDVNRNMTALSIDGEIVVTYNTSLGNWTVWYYDSGSRDSYEVTVDATSQPNQIESVIVVRNSTYLSIHANATNSNAVSLSGSSTVAAPNESTWDGRLEEIRLSDVPFNSTVRTNHYTDPIDPLIVQEDARIMFDQPDKNQQLLFYNSGHIDQNNVTFRAGLPGSELVASGTLLQQSDYEWDANGPRIRPIAGGELENAPVAYVDYDVYSMADEWIENWNEIMAMMAIVLILLPVGVILTYLQQMNTRR